MPEYTVKIIESEIIVGRDEGNHFSIEITPSSGELKNVIVRLSIPYGPNKNGENTFLLEDEAARPNVNYRLSGDSGTKPIDLLKEGAKPEPRPHYLAWEIPSRGIVIGADSTMEIDIAGLPGNIPPSEAKVIVEIRERGPVEKKEFTEKVLSVSVSLKPGDEEGVKIHYFDASKDYILHAGEEEVVLSWHTTTAAKVVTLFKNNVKVWPPHGGSPDLFFKDKPGITSVYRLEARPQAIESDGESTDERTSSLNEDRLVVRPLTVQVAQAGWNRQPLHQGYPTVLMKALSFTAGEGERLYGVFVDPKTEATGLYSSATGFPPWRKESNGQDFKEIRVVDENKNKYFLSEMSHSPGVACDNKLWLIGGSSVDPTKVSNEVWYYHKGERTKKGEWVRDKSGPFSRRMGHCVVAFKNKLWVLGGSDGNRPSNEVWSYDYRAGQWSPDAIEADWPARCMFAAAVTPSIEGVSAFEEEKMWVYGGTEDPYDIDAKTDLWSTTDGVTWKPEVNLELGPLSGQPNGATLFWDDDRLHLAGSFKAGTREEARDDAGATLSAMVYSLCAERFLWEANPVSWGWEQFGGDAFLMQSIVFNRFWFFWSLNQRIKRAPKLNVFIPA